eukprot:scpid56087/ scgid34763/ 
MDSGGGESLGLESVNRLLRQQGLSALSAQPLTSILDDNDLLLEGVLLGQTALSELRGSLQQLIADGEHSRNVNQQLMTELQNCRNSLQEEKQRCGTMRDELQQQKRLKTDLQAANEELSGARLEELKRHSREVDELKDGRDAAWAMVGVLNRDNNALKARLADSQNADESHKKWRAPGTRTRRLSDGDRDQPYVQTLGLLSTSREQIHKLQHDINGMRKDMQDCREASSNHTSPLLEHRGFPSSAPHQHASTQSPSPPHRSQEAAGQSPTSDDVITVAGRVLNTDVESRSEVLNSTLETDTTEWALLGEKVERLSKSNVLLQNDLDNCKRKLQQAALETACLKSVCTQLSVSDHTQLPSAVERLMVAVGALPTLEEFYREVTKVVPAPLQDDVDSDTTATEEASSHHHANWCAVQWNHVIPTIRLWKQAVDDAVEPSNGKTSRRSLKALQSTVQHIQSLFDIAHVSSIVPLMNSVYLRLKEAETLKKALRDVLGLDSKCGVSRIISVAESLTDSEHCQTVIKLTLEREKLKASLDNSTQLLVSFRDLMSQILSIVGVDAPSKIPQEVARLKLQVLTNA